MRLVPRKIGAGLGGASFLLAGAIAFGAFPSNRHQNRGYGDAANHTKRQPEGDNAQVGRSVTIRKPRAELFAFWSDFSNLPQFMENVEAGIEAGGDGCTGPGGLARPRADGRGSENRNRPQASRTRRSPGARSRISRRSRPAARFASRSAPGERGTRVSPGDGLRPACRRALSAERWRSCSWRRSRRSRPGMI